MNDIKMVATDLDGTLFDNQRKINQEKFDKLLTYFEAHDMHFVIATGNDQPLVDMIFEPFIGRFDYNVNNGDQVKTKTGKSLRSSAFTRTDLPEIQALIEKGDTMHFRHGIIFKGIQNSYMLAQYKGIGDLYQEIRWYFPNLKFIDEISDIPETEEIVKVIFSTAESEAKSFIKRINESFSEKYHATTSGYGAIDVIPANTNKATGLTYLLDYYDLNADQVMAFDDGFNDLEMLNFVGEPSSLPNGDAYLINHFKTAIASNDQDGVLDTIITELALPLT